MHSYEIEIKSLLGNKAGADQLIAKMRSDPTFKPLGAHKQLNHYFVGGDLKTLKDNLPDLKIPEHAKDFSVRTRGADGKVLLVIKATVDDTTSSNGTARLEFESEANMPLDELDKIVLNSGFKYQAKWSRERQEVK